MELFKLVLVVTAVAISTCPKFTHSMTLFYPRPVEISNDRVIIGVGLYKDGQYGIVCDEGDTNITNFLCSNLGSFGNDSYTDLSMLNVSFTNYSCPSGLSSCGEAASIVSNCTSSPLMIECNCFPGHVRLTNTVNASTNSGVAFVGYPEVCVNDSFIPICNGTELGATELIYICANQSINSSSSLIGKPHNVTLSPLMSSSASSVTGYDCDTMANCTVTTGMNCTSGYLIVTCEGAIPNGTSSSPTSSSTPTSDSASTVISASSSPTPTSDSGASVGAIVGGSVGGVVAVIVIVTILVIAVLMYRKKHKSP